MWDLNLEAAGSHASHHVDGVRESRGGMRKAEANGGEMGKEDSQPRAYQAGCTVDPGGLSHWGLLGASEQKTEVPSI